MLDQPALSEPRQPLVSPPAAGPAPRPPAPEWPEPDLCLLDDWRGHLPAFPVEALPKAWRAWAPRAAHGANASVDHVALSLLTVAASQIGHARRISPVPSWSEPCILWTALVGPPSSGKTPAMDTALHTVRALERRLAIAYDEACREREHKVARAGEELRRALQNGAALPRNAPEWEVNLPPPRPLSAGNATIEVMADALRRSDRGVLLPCDERGDWLASMVRDDSQRPFWLSAWSGRPILVDCKGWPAFSLPCPGISVLGTIAPGAIEPALTTDDDRVIARFLFAWSERPSFHSLSELAAAARPEDREALAALARLYDMPGAARTLPLEADALSLFDGFRRLHDVEAARLDGREAAWWGKGPGTVLRLAGTLTFLAWAAEQQGTAEPTQVPAWTIKAASRLWQHYLWPHARAVFRIAGNSGEESHGQKVLRWIKREGRDEVSRTELRREALSRSFDAAATGRIAQSLVTAGWLKPIDPAPQSRGRRPVRWAVNPALKGTAHAS